MSQATFPVVVGSIGVGLIAIVSCSYLFRRKRGKNTSEVRSPPLTVLESNGVAEPTNSTFPSSSKGTVNDVWEERRQRGIQAASLHTKKDITGKKEKPFGSSYYYAHNSTKTTGGYKDGLTMEDFTMNGPRLLSRNGAPVVNDDPSIDTKSTETDDSAFATEIKSDPNKSELQTRRRVIPVSKYLWDDPGNKDGVATIRVDTLATFKSNSSEDIDWKMIRPFITSIDASLSGIGKEKDGLYVKIQADTPPSDGNTSSTLLDGIKQAIPIEYILQIPKLYGHVHKVDCVSKEKRLLIRLYKRSTVFDKSNLKVWPHPQKKIA